LHITFINILTEMRITKKFLALTKKTYPHGKEHELIDHLPKGYQQDGLGNFYLQIGDKPSTMFTCHLDTADRTQSKVNHVFQGNIIKTDGKSILGADDKAGMTVILYMISKGVPGLYYFFIGEEVGCVGSRKLAAIWKDTEFSKYVTKVVSFDRRGTGSVITHQMFGRCCSDEFAKELADRLNAAGCGLSMRLDDTGILTDSAKFMPLVSECTNISVGYESEHTCGESQDIEFLKKIARAASLIDWETLPSKRDPKEEDDSDYYGWGSFGSRYDYGNYSEKEEKSKWTEENYTHVKLDGKTKRVYISNDQIEEEKALIYRWLGDHPEYYDIQSVVWNGNSLYFESRNGMMEFAGTRSELMDMIPELASIPKSAISEVFPGRRRTFINAL
jgi:hypothetical protein